jgi:small subunit ribosomal protein S1
VCKVGDDMEVKILRVDTDERKIGLSRKRVEWNEEDAKAAEAAGATAGATPAVKKRDPKELKGGLGGGGPLIPPTQG